jgi:hypothetical protein
MVKVFAAREQNLRHGGLERAVFLLQADFPSSLRLGMNL